MCDLDRNSELHPHLRGDPAAKRLREAYAKAGIRGADRPGEDHAGIQSSMQIHPAYGRTDHHGGTDGGR